MNLALGLLVAYICLHACCSKQGEIDVLTPQGRKKKRYLYPRHGTRKVGQSVTRQDAMFSVFQTSRASASRNVTETYCAQNLVASPVTS